MDLQRIMPADLNHVHGLLPVRMHLLALSQGPLRRSFFLPIPLLFITGSAQSDLVRD